MDPETVRVLEDLPDDLAMRGWALVSQEAKTYKTTTGTIHVAVYQRPYHSPVDHLGTAITVRAGYVYVSTRDARSTSWDEAREAAIGQMRAIDGPRPNRDEGAP